MEEEKIIENKKNNKVIWLSIVGVLIVILLGVGIFYFLNRENSENVYQSLIDRFATSLTNNLEILDNDTKAIQYDGDVSFNLKTNNSLLKDLKNILNKLVINVSIETDSKNKRLNGEYDLLYNSSSLVKLGTYINDKEVFADLGAIYNKNILLGNTVEGIWNNNTEEYSVIVKESSNILKNSLKKEYFEKKNATISIDGKKVKVTNHRLILNDENTRNIYKSVCDGILNNEKLLEALTSLGANLDTIKESVESFKENIDSYHGTDTFINVYTKGNNEVVRIDVESESVLSLTKNSDDKFAITIDDEKIGSLELSDEKILLELSIEGSTLKLEITQDKENASIKASISDDEKEVSLTVEKNKDSIKGNIKALNLLGDDSEFVVNLDMKAKDIKEAEAKNITNYIKAEDLTEDDYETIMTNLAKSDGLVSLVGDLLLLGDMPGMNI